MAISTRPIRDFMFQNASSGKIYHVQLLKQSDGSVNGIGKLLGTDKVNSEPSHDNTIVTFVVITGKVDEAFAQHESALAYAAYYDASSAAAGGAALSTLLV